jgi:hypothetical protein
MLSEGSLSGSFVNTNLIGNSFVTEEKSRNSSFVLPNDDFFDSQEKSLSKNNPNHDSGKKKEIK